MQVPVRYALAPQLTLLHVVHVPLVVAPDPFRNWLLLHDGWLLHLKPLVVPEHEPLRYWLLAQFVLLQVLHLNPFVVPPHDPDLYVPLLQFVLLQVLHLKPLVVPLHEPERYWPLLHRVFEQPLQLYFST